MRILLDTTTAPAQPAGAGRYAIELARALAQEGHGHEVIALDRWGHLQATHGLRVRHVPLRSRTQRACWEQAVLPGLARWLRADLLHSTHHSLPLLPTGCPTVVTVHDLNPWLLPNRYPPARRLYLRLSTILAVRRAEAVIVPSHAVAADARRLLRLSRARLHVVYEAAAARFRPQSTLAVAALRARLGLPPRYILSLGTLEPGKNRATLLRAFAIARRRGLPQELVIAGQPGWLQAGLLHTVERLGLGGSVHFSGYVPDADLPALYAGAELFAFPSLAEGFGLPPLEAMACGTPVLASNAASLPEVLGAAALYTPARDAAALAAAIERILCDEQLRQELKQLGLAQAARYSWQQAARETLAVYAAAAGR